MLGNWSLGDYWKKESIEYSLEFLEKILKIPKEKLEVTCFKGDKDAPKDTEAKAIWKSLGINKIKFLGKKDNWWGPTGKIGPCGPDTEIFVGGVEIWNNVFMQYVKDEKENYNEANQKNIDTGMGVERTIAIMNNLDDNYLTNSFKPIIEKIEKFSKEKYGKDKEKTKSMRIIADHVKASVFIIADGITPGNKEHGYILRRLIRRSIRHGKNLMMQNNFTKELSEIVIDIYDDYPHLKKNKKIILEEIEKEEKKFRQTLASGLKFFKKILKGKKEISGKDSFLLYQSYGFPIEMIEEECKKNKIKFSVNDFEKEIKKHQELSRTASAGKFKSGLADTSEETTKLHTANHLVLEALKKVLKDKNIMQKGSNITSERLRFDFTFPRKVTPEEIKKVEDLVNKQIKKGLKVTREEMSPQEAKKQGASGAFDEKYGELVFVYTMGDFSKEICTGPHVKNTKELGKFKITKEQSSSSGIRRIKAVLE
jgi:alanyl-tRNA synthetase